MSKWNEAVTVTFNDNDGKVGWSVNPEASPDLHRHWMIFGKWRTRWILFKQFWLGLVVLEQWTQSSWKKPKRLWVFKAEIPE